VDVPVTHAHLLHTFADKKEWESELLTLFMFMDFADLLVVLRGLLADAALNPQNEGFDPTMR
jgi:hypothetical protein